MISSSGDPNLAAIAQEAAGGSAPVQPMNPIDEIPKGLCVWREAVSRSQTSAQLAMCLYMLETAIAWDKSIMKAVSQSRILKNLRSRICNQLSVRACAFYLTLNNTRFPWDFEMIALSL